MVVNSHPLYQLSYRGSEIVPAGPETIAPEYFDVTRARL